VNKIELKSNRSFILKTFLPFAIIASLFIVIMIIGLIIDFDNMSQNILVLLLFIAIDICYIVGILIAKYYKGKSYIFYYNKIEIYNKGKFQYEIEVGNIRTMNYYPFKWHYIITIYAGSLNEGGAWKIHITDSQGKKQTLGFIVYKDAKRLQQLYPDLLKIMYERKKEHIDTK